MNAKQPGRSAIVALNTGVADNYRAIGPLPPGTVVNALVGVVWPSDQIAQNCSVEAVVGNDDSVGTSTGFAAGRSICPSVTILSAAGACPIRIPLNFVATESERVLGLYFSDPIATAIGYLAFELEYPE